MSGHDLKQVKMRIPKMFVSEGISRKARMVASSSSASLWVAEEQGLGPWRLQRGHWTRSQGSSIELHCLKQIVASLWALFLWLKWRDLAWRLYLPPSFWFSLVCEARKIVTLRSRRSRYCKHPYFLWLSLCFCYLEIWDWFCYHRNHGSFKQGHWKASK